MAQASGELLQPHAENHPEPDDADERGDGPWPAQFVPELEEEVGAGRGDSSVSEVEDTACAVREHQADARQPVHGSGSDPDDDEREELAHDRVRSSRWRPSRRSRTRPRNPIRYRTFPAAAMTAPATPRLR